MSDHAPDQPADQPRDHPADQPSDQMADADVANGESGILNQGFEEQQGQRPGPVEPARTAGSPGDADDDDDDEDPAATDSP